MTLERFLEPLSGDLPCGPDLMAEDDDAFIDYYFSAQDRIPEKFINSAEGKFFDRSQIDLAAELKQVEPLLDRSRDLRLLAILAQFACLSGDLRFFADCTLVMAGLLESHWEKVHPSVDEDPIERRNALELLDSTAAVVLPLEFMTLATDRRLQKLTFRRYAISSGARSPVGDENAEDGGAIVTALRNVENAPQVDASFAALQELQSALRRIEVACIGADSQAFRPNFDRLQPQIEQILALLVEARPDLADENGAGDNNDDIHEDNDTPELEQAGDAATKPSTGTDPATSGIRNHAGALAALSATESYFARKEPSSPALILVRQARFLVGKPLVQALELLLPEHAQRARIDFGSDNGFLLTMERMRELSGTSSPEEGATDDEETAPVPPATTRDQAVALMSSVEGFFRQTEPSSPIPALLFKARTYLNRDFTSILADLLPQTQG